MAGRPETLTVISGLLAPVDSHGFSERHPDGFLERIRSRVYAAAETP